MDRSIVYPGSIPQDTDILSANRNAMVALGVLMQAVLGTATVADGLACTPTTPASMSVLVGPGSLAALATVDATAYGTLAADTTDALVKMGINLATSSFALTAPAGTGQAVNYLVQASFSEADATAVVLPYYNAANPSQPYSGPANAGVAQNTQRLQRVLIQVQQGLPSVAGTQFTPSPSPGAVGLFVVTVNYAQSFIASGSIFPYPAAPFIQHKLPTLTPGYSTMQVIPGNLSFTPAQGVTRVKLRMLGGGGGGATGSGGGGGGGGSVEGFYPVTPGTGIACTVGAAGTAGSAGGASSFGTMAVAGGGGGGSGSTGGAGGAGSGTGLLTTGRAGQAGLATSALLIGGAGGGSHFGDGAATNFAASGSNQPGQAGVLPGAGGAGGVGSGAGGAGASGLIIVEW